MFTSCQTKENIEKEKAQNEIKLIDEQLESVELPKQTQEWLLDVKTDAVATILCITSSSKCKKLEKLINDINNSHIYFIYLDKIEEEIKKIYKETFELNDYTGYLPYIFITNKNKISYTHTDTLSEDKLNSILKENKIIR